MEHSIYKSKYLSLKQRYATDLDTAFRLGYEKGSQEAQMELQMQQIQQQQQAMAAQQAAMAGQANPAAAGDEGAEEMSPEEAAAMEAQGGGEQMPPEAMQAQGGQPIPEEAAAEQGELDSKIAELENLLSKGEKPKILDLRKAVQELSTVRKSQIEKYNQKSKKVETEQRKLVKGILSKWSEESKSVTKDLEKILETDGLKLGE